MTNAAAFRAGYADWKLVKTRGVVQIVLEIPIEASGQAYDVLGGMPNPASEVWVGVARLKPESEVASYPKLESQSQPDNATAAPIIPTGPARPAKRWSDKSLGQQAAIRCTEPKFWLFLEKHYDYLPIGSKEDAADVVRELCHVETRRDIKPGEWSGEQWKKIDDAYYLSQLYPEQVG